MQLSGILFFLRKNALYILLIALPLISIAMHWRAFQADLMGRHAWRQAQTQTVIVNFYEEDFNILNPRSNARGSGDGIQRMEFPLMQWLFACFYKIFGNHLIITRILTFFTGIGSLAGMFFLLKNLFKDRLAALVGAWALQFSPSFFYFTVNPLPDNFALCCSIWGLAFFYHWYEKRKLINLLASGFFLCLATLSKLPFIIFFTVPFVSFLYELYRKKVLVTFAAQSLAVTVFIIPPAVWYAWVIPGWQGTDVVKGMLANQTPVRQLLQFALDNLISILPELLLNYASVPFFIAGFYYLIVRKAYRDPRFLPLATLGIAAILYFLFEINMIANVHDYYLFPFVPLLFILVSYGALHWLNGSANTARAALFLLLLLPVTAHLRTKNSWNPDAPGFNKDWLLYKNELRAVSPRNALCVVGNDVSYQIFFYHLDKKGWAFTDDRLTVQRLNAMIYEGAQYLFSDTRQIDENPGIRPMLDSLVLEKGSVRVFRLRK